LTYIGYYITNIILFLATSKIAGNLGKRYNNREWMMQREEEARKEEAREEEPYQVLRRMQDDRI